MSNNQTILTNTLAATTPLRFIVAGGGTGGHIFPAIAIANAIKKIQPTAQFLFVGAIGKMEMEKVPQAGYEIKGLNIAGFNRSSMIKNITLPFKLIQSLFAVRSIFKNFNPTAVIGVGGYSSFPVLRYAQNKGIPTFIHESNSFAGKSNILLGKNATTIFTATDNMEKFFPLNKITITGNPIRQSISHSTATKQDAISFFNLDGSKKTVLVVGGSLGAKSINEAIGNNIDVFSKNNLQLIWQTGKPYFDEATKLIEGHDNIFMSSFISQMENAYAAADLVISRSGAMAVAELCMVGKPVIFVPYPHAAEDHQTANAQALVNKNAAQLIKDNVVQQLLIPTMLNLCHNDELQHQLKNNISKLAVQNADEIIAEQILQVLQAA